MKLRVKIALGFGALLLILGLEGLVGYTSFVEMDRLSSEAEHSADLRRLARDMNLQLEREVSAVRGFLLSGNAKILDSYNDASQKFEKDSAEIDRLHPTEQAEALHNKIQKLRAAFEGAAEKQIDLRRAGQAPKTMDLDAELISALDALLAQQKDVHDQAVKAQVAFESTAKILVLVPSLGGLIIGIVVAFLSGRAVSKAMSRVIDRVKEVAQGDGDLTRRLPVTSQDEIGELSGWFNMFIGRVHEIIVQVSANANRLASSGEEISTASAQQAQGAETQKDQVRQVATAMQEMSSTVLDVSQNSLRAADAAGKAAAMARQGGEIVEGTLTKIRAVSESVGQTAEQVQALGQRSDQIGEIIGVIDEIAGQTNLLALNAAIEAARAGEQGRGFAVVADEVRKLAERTSRATKEIAQMIQGIQAETRSAVQAMQAGTDQVEQGLNTTAQAGAALREIIKMAEQVGEMVTQIATASTEQSSATEEVSSSVEQISRITEESASGAMQSAKACHELSEMALDLQNLVSQFKLEEHKRPVVLSARLARAA